MPANYEIVLSERYPIDDLDPWASQYRFAMLVGEDTVGPATLGAGALGVFGPSYQFTPQTAPVYYSGRVLVVAGAAITASQQLQSDANGAAIPLDGGVDIGCALQGAEPGQVISIFLGQNGSGAGRVTHDMAGEQVLGGVSQSASLHLNPATLTLAGAQALSGVHQLAELSSGPTPTMLNIPYPGLSSAALIQFEAMLGQHVDGIPIYGGFTKSIADYTSSLRFAFEEGQLGYAGLQGGYAHWTVTLPMCCTPEAGYGDESLTTLNDGEYDALWLENAEYLSATIPGTNPIDVRLGWEFNGNWYPWAATADTAALYASVLRRMWGIVSGVDDRFRLWISPAAGNQGSPWQFDWTLCYPGDDIVYGVSCDRYYDPVSAGGFDNNNPTTAFNNALDADYIGLTAIRAFAADHGKAFAVNEYGIYGAGGSDGVGATWLGLFIPWLQENGALFQGYFQDAAGDQGISNGQFPLSAAAYLGFFGTAYDITWQAPTYATGSGTAEITIAGVTYGAETANGQLANTGAAPWAQKVPTSASEAMRFEVRSGDFSWVDSPLTTKNRSELDSSFGGLSFSFGTTYWFSYSFLIEDGTVISSHSPQWCIMGQVHSSDSTRSPPLALSFAPGDYLQILSRSESTFSSGIVNYTAPDPIRRGFPHFIVMEVEFEKLTAGLLNVWLDGAQIVNYTGDIGYNEAAAGYWKWGIYRNQAAETIAAQIANLEFGTSSLFSRVDNPLLFPTS